MDDLGNPFDNVRVVGLRWELQHFNFNPRPDQRSMYGVALDKSGFGECLKEILSQFGGLGAVWCGPLSLGRNPLSEPAALGYGSDLKLQT